MDAYGVAVPFGQGVGATAEARLTTLAPLIEFHEREMGELPGRLMLAVSFLGDLKLMPGWESRAREAQAAVVQAEALVVSVMTRLLTAQQGCDCETGDEDGIKNTRDSESTEERDGNGEWYRL